MHRHADKELVEMKNENKNSQSEWKLFFLLHEGLSLSLESDSRSPYHFPEIMPMMIQNSYKTLHSLAKKQAAAVTQWSRTTQELNVNFCIRDPAEREKPLRLNSHRIINKCFQQEGTADSLPAAKSPQKGSALDQEDAEDGLRCLG